MSILFQDLGRSEVTRKAFGCDVWDVGNRVVLTPWPEVLEIYKSLLRMPRLFRGWWECVSGEYKGKRVFVVCFGGGVTNACDVTFLLTFTDCEYLLYSGAVEALSRDAKIGDVIAATGAIRGDGASEYYVGTEYPALASFELLERAWSLLSDWARGEGVKVHKGIIYSLPAITAESRELLTSVKDLGVIGVDVETAPIYVVASIHGIKPLAVHVVCSKPLEGKTLLHDLSEGEESRKERSYRLLPRVILEVVSSI